MFLSKLELLTPDERNEILCVIRQLNHPVYASGGKLNLKTMRSLWNDMPGLKDIVDNGTTVVTIPTPKGWRCRRKGCRNRVKHTHGTYPTLKKKP